MRPLHELLIEAANRQQLTPSTRRGVLTLAGAAATVPAALGIETALAQVQAEHGNPAQRRRRRAQRGKKQQQGNRRNDIRILNYALTLEHLEAAFYTEGVGNDQGQGGVFDEDDFNAFDDRDADLFDRLVEIGIHERAHVTALIATIENLGGDPVEPLCYDFGYNNANQFLEVAQALENTGVSAYDGAIADIRSGELQTTGATIATVEARHASYLNFINGDSPFPDAFDMPLNMDEVLEIAGSFIIDCP